MLTIHSKSHSIRQAYKPVFQSLGDLNVKSDQNYELKLAVSQNVHTSKQINKQTSVFKIVLECKHSVDQQDTVQTVKFLWTQEECKKTVKKPK